MDHSIVWEFRPLPGYFEKDFYRYADGKWIPDDGEYDLAFIGTRKFKHDGGWPFSVYVRPGRQNIICSWTTGHWSAKEPKHPDQNAWHYALHGKATEWGDCCPYSHPNLVAGDAASSQMAKKKGCCNGDPVEFRMPCELIKAGLLKNRETKEVFQWPANLSCMYCGQSPLLLFIPE